MTTKETDSGGSAGGRVPLLQKLGFAWWGIRYFDILVLMAYPTLGAVFAIQELTPPVLARFLVFTFFNFLFVAHVYIYNDLSDARLNPEEPLRRSRHALKYPALSSRQVFMCSLGLGAAAFVGFAFISWRLLVVAVLLEAITVSYSHPRINLKGRPVVSTLIHFAGASLYFMGGWAAFQPFTSLELALAVFFGLVLAAGHFSNEIQDFNQDLGAGIRTNAVAFGQRTMFRVGLMLFMLSSAWLLIVSRSLLDHPAYAYAAAALLVVWLIESRRRRSWKGGDSIREFRRFYRALYAALSLALVAIRMSELL